nr:MFS transporter [Clostridium scatologenes]
MYTILVLKGVNKLHTQSKNSSFVLTRLLTLLMAIACGLAVANLYYIQPLESQIADTFHITQNMAGIAATLTQIGYAFGLLLLVPLGDMAERKSMILRILLLVDISLLMAAWSPFYGLLLIVMFAVGFTTIVPQLIIPYAAHLAHPEEQGKIIGNLMGGLLMGILLSRTLSGLIGSAFNWRIVYLLAAILMSILAIIIKYFFPKSQPTSKISYSELMKSIPKQIKKERTLRESAINGFFMFGAFSAFWTSLIFLLETPFYNMGTREAGLFGLAGIAGAIAAPLIGKMADKKSPRFIVGIGVMLSTLAYLCFWFLGLHLWGLIIGIIILDLGNQFGQVSNMARVQSLSDSMRSRNGTVFMFFYFMGGACGSFLGTLFWQNFAWKGVCTVGIIFMFMAITSHFIIYRLHFIKKRKQNY